MISTPTDMRRTSSVTSKQAKLPRGYETVQFQRETVQGDQVNTVHADTEICTASPVRRYGGGSPEVIQSYSMTTCPNGSLFDSEF
jgi:hypothetical protein